MAKVILKRVRLAFPVLWEPKPFGRDAAGAARCGASLLIDPQTQADQMQLVVKVMQEQATERWGVKAGEMFKVLKAKGDLCLHDGNTKANYEGFLGMVFVSASNPARPVVVDNQRNPLTQADGKPYAGCYVNASIDVWAQDNGFGKRINAKLLALQFVEDGEAFTGGEGYDDADFEDLTGGSATAGDGFFTPGAAAPAPPAADDSFFGGGTPAAAPAADDSFFGSAETQKEDDNFFPF